MRNAPFLLSCMTALFIAGLPLGGSQAQEPSAAFEIAVLPAAGCAEPGQNFPAKKSEHDAALGDGARLAQACESPRCPAGRIPCNYQIRPNGCVAWRCCIGR